MAWSAVGACAASAQPACASSQSLPSQEPSAAEPSAAEPPAEATIVPGAQVPGAVVERVEYRGAGLGTQIHLVGYTSEHIPRRGVERAFSSALSVMKQLETLLSDWTTDSDVGRINAAPGQFVAVSPETSFVVQQALWSGSISEGAFDLTYAVLSPFWKFGDARESIPRLPAPTSVERRLAHVDYRLVQVDASTHRVRVGAEQQIGLGGIAKGYIVDRMTTELRAQGMTSFLVQAGGDLYAAGVKPGGAPWEAGVQDPRQPAGHSFAKLALSDRAFSTAGDYARAFFVEGRRYHHILDPQTGYPSTRSRSVTVWAKTALLADAIDDAVFVLGPEKGLALVESLNDVGAIIVDSQNRLWVSQALRSRIRLSHLPSDGP